MAETLRKDASARAVFEAMPPSHQREYLCWIGEAKKAETREKRIREATHMIKAWGQQQKKKARR